MVADTPGASRPMTYKSCGRLDGTTGVQKSVPLGYSRPCGITPMIVYDTPSSYVSSWRPTIVGSPPNLRCQIP